VPYSGDTAISVAYRHVNDDVPAPSTVSPDIPPALDDLVSRVTRRDPEARPADAEAFLRELRQVRTSLGLRPVAIPVLPPKEQQLPDVERTMPAISPVAATEPVSGPRGTRAMTRFAPPVQPPPPPAAAAEPGPGRGKIALRAALALVVIGLLGTLVWWFAGGNKTVTGVEIPNVVGMDRTAAAKALQDKGFTAKFSQQPSNTITAGLAIGSDPAGGTSVTAGSQVTVRMSTGQPKVPDIVNAARQDADAAIQAQQLQPVHDASADDYSASVAKDHVISVSPQPGTPVQIGGTVRYGLSKGTPPNPVPDVTGKSRDEAFQLLQSQGFQPFDAGAEFSGQVPAGFVTRTDPAAGSTPGSLRVGVYVSNAVQVPSLFGMSAEQALQTLAQAGLQGEVQGGGHRGGFGIVIDQDPAAGKLVKQGTKVKLKMFP